MKINYVENKNGKLFSFHRHDFKENTDSSETTFLLMGVLKIILDVQEN